MQVVEFADGRDAGERHLQETHPGGGLDFLRRERRRGVIHFFAPGPEGVAGGARAMLGAAADHALETVRVGVYTAGQQGLTGQPHRAGQIVGFAR